MATDLLEKIGKLLVLAERTTNEDEKQAFFDKAQRLSTTYSIDAQVARQAVLNREKRQVPVVKRIMIGEKGKPLNAVFCSLFTALGRPQDVTFNIASNSTFVNAFGFESDIGVAEALYANITVQMVKMADEFIKTGSWRGEMTWDTSKFYYKPVTARVARRCFYESFIDRVGLRLRMEKQRVEEEISNDTVETVDGPTTKGLVIRDKQAELRDFYAANSTARGKWKGNRGNTAYSSAGDMAGHTAGKNAQLSGRKSIGGGIKELR